MILQQIQNYTDKECFEFLAERFPDNHYRDELFLPIKQIIGYSKIKRKTAIASLNDLLKIVNSAKDKIYLLAAYYLIRTQNTMESRNLSIVKNELAQYTLKLSRNETRTGCPIDKAITREALVKKIFALKNELQTIHQKYKVDPNITVTGEIIEVNGSESIF